jgi:hypothetical protein
VPVAISQDVEAMLIDAGLLGEWDADDPSEVAAAVEKLRSTYWWCWSKDGSSR